MSIQAVPVASQVVYNQQPTNVTAGVADSPSIVVDVEDQFGSIVTTDSSNVTLSVASGPGSLPGTVTVAAVNGVAMFNNIKLDAAGNYTLTASDGALTTATSNSFTVSAAAASKLAYSVQPSNVTAGVADSPSIVVDVEDQFGNIVTSDSSNVTLSVATGPGDTVRYSDSCRQQWHCHLQQHQARRRRQLHPDRQRWRSDHRDIEQFHGESGCGVQARLQCPAEQRHRRGRRQSVHRRRCGRPVQQYRHDRQLECDSVGRHGPRRLSGTVTVAASSGIATFSNIKLDAAGNYTLTASDGALTTATSNSFTVSAAAASKLAYSVQPSNVTAGVADSPSIVVDVEDQFGNIVTTDSSNVTLSVAGGPAAMSGTVTVAASSGIATFSNIKLDAAGSYTLTASDGA